MIEQIARAILDDLRRVAPLSGSDIFYDAETGCVDFEGAFRPAEIAQAIIPLIEAAVLAERERCAVVAEQQAQEFLSPQYAVGLASSSFNERFACSEVAKAIRSQP